MTEGAMLDLELETCLEIHTHVRRNTFSVVTVVELRVIHAAAANRWASIPRRATALYMVNREVNKSLE